MAAQIIGATPYVRPYTKEDRIKFIEFLESKGFMCIEDNGHCRASIVESELPLMIDINEKTISCMGNVTCAAAAASQKIIMGPELFYKLYSKWKDATQTAVE